MTSLQHQVAGAPALIESIGPGAKHDPMLALVCAAGRRNATTAATTAALQACWGQLSRRTVRQRLDLLDAVRAAVRSGATTSRAWLPLALGEIEPALIGAAVAGYLGEAPCSIDRRAHALEDVLQWFRRGLALDRLAVFAALLHLRDPGVNERLATVRGRLTDAERARVFAEFESCADATTQEFFADWRTCGG